MKDKMLKVMLDTNVLVKFAFVLNKIYLNKPIPKNLKRYGFILNKLEDSKFLNIMSDWNKCELRDVLIRLKLAEVYFLSGFTVDEFRDAKNEKIRLSVREITAVNDLVFEIWNFCERSTAINLNMSKIKKWNRRGFSTMDLILLNQAELHKCDYFVTNDKQLYENNELEKDFDIKICPIKEFRNKFT